jgi:hypothetical protein
MPRIQHLPLYFILVDNINYKVLCWKLTSGDWEIKSMGVWKLNRSYSIEAVSGEGASKRNRFVMFGHRALAADNCF